MQDFLFPSTKLVFQSRLRPEIDTIPNFCDHFRKTLAFSDIVQFTTEPNVVTFIHFVRGTTLYPQNPTKLEHNDWVLETISRSCENFRCVQSKDQQNCFIDKEHSFELFLEPYSLRDLGPVDPFSLNHTFDRNFMRNW